MSTFKKTFYITEKDWLFLKHIRLSWFLKTIFRQIFTGEHSGTNLQIAIDILEGRKKVVVIEADSGAQRQPAAVRSRDRETVREDVSKTDGPGFRGTSPRLKDLARMAKKYAIQKGDG